jgi:hypothetical protein
MRTYGLFVPVFSLALVMVASARTQAQISISPMAGAYTQASDFKSLRSQADTLRLKRSSKLALGLNAEVGPLRGSLAYVSGADLTSKGPTNTTNVGQGNLLAGAVDLVIRPLPRVFVQPYVFGGAGLKHVGYSYNANGIGDAFPKDKSDFTLHAGVGADLMLGGFGVVAEVSDFISKNGTGSYNAHDAFGMVGVKVKL